MIENQDPERNVVLKRVMGRDNANALVGSGPVIAAPGLGLQIAIRWVKISVKTADDIEWRTSVTPATGVVDVDFLPATGNVIKRYEERPLYLGDNNALYIGKGTAGTNLFYQIGYDIVKLNNSVF